MKTPINRLKAALARGEVQIGLWMGFAHPGAAEIAAGAGFDWCLIDAEHGPTDLPLALAQLQAMGDATSAVLRLPQGDRHLVKQALDLGVQTILIPMVDTAEQAAEMGRAMRYPPEGSRGVGAIQSRATRYGAIGDYVSEANAQACLIVQIESRTALDNLDEIAAQEGVDALFIGPADLAASLGYPGRPDAHEVREAIADAARRIRSAGKPLGMIAFDMDGVRDCLSQGASFVSVGGDIALYRKALVDRVEAVRAALAEG